MPPPTSLLPPTSLRRYAAKLLLKPLLLTLGSLSADSVAAAPIKVFLMGGQSNMRGRAAAGGLPAALQAEQRDILICRGSQSTVGATLELLKPNDPALDGYTFGPDVTFGRTIADIFPSADFALLKFAVGGTSLGGAWSINSGTAYQGFRQTAANGLALLEAAGYEPEIVGMLWHQGESNAGNTQAQYESLLRAFIGDMRTHYGANLPFMIGGINLNNTGTDLIVAAQIAVAASDPYAVFVPASDLSFSDTVHFDAPGMMTLGERFAQHYAAHFETLINGPGSETTLPTLVSTDPQNGGTMNVFSDLSATFSEFVVLSGHGSLTLRNLEDITGAKDIVIALPDPQVTDSGTRISINPTSNLAANTDYAIRISSNAIVDLAGNPYAGISTDNTWFFSTSAPVSPALVVHEPFGDDDSSLPGNTPGTGLAGTWAGSTASVITTGLTFGNLATGANAAQVTGGWANNQVDITSSSAYSDLLAHGGAMWFSIVFRANVTGVSNAYNRFAFGIGSSAFGSNGDLASGQAIGFGNSQGKIYAGLWETTNWGADNLQGAPPATAVNANFGTLPSNTPTLIVGYAQWGADAASPDTVTLFMPGADLSMGSEVASSRGVVNQAAFDKLMTHNGNTVTSRFDEIRIGATYADVVPSAIIPPSFATWQTANVTTGGPGEDHDGDGVQNGIEFFLMGAAASTGPTVLPGVTESDGGFRITWPKAASYPGIYGTHYMIETSPTLLPGSWVAAPPGNLLGNLTYIFQPAGGRAFVRLKVTGP